MLASFDNISSNRYPNNILEMTGPNLNSKVLKKCFEDYPATAYRIYGVDYEGKIKIKYWLSGLSFRKKSIGARAKRNGQS